MCTSEGWEDLSPHSSPGKHHFLNKFALPPSTNPTSMENHGNGHYSSWVSTHLSKRVVLCEVKHCVLLILVLHLAQGFVRSGPPLMFAEFN